MRLVPRHWSNETWICSLRGHVTPASLVRNLRVQDAGLGFDDNANGVRFARCLRCDAWIRGEPVFAHDAPEYLEAVDQLALPRRGRALEDAIFLRVIAIERAIHCVLFTLLAIGLALLEFNLASLQRVGGDIADKLNGAVAESGQQASRSFVTRSLHELLTLRKGAIEVLLITAIIYALLEGVEAVGLWRERRWAEYLTVIATVGFLPFELIELVDRVTALRIGALIVNLAVLGWLLWAKRLFGLRGGARALEAVASQRRQETLDTLSAS